MCFRLPPRCSAKALATACCWCPRRTGRCACLTDHACCPTCCADANERYDVVLAAGGPTPAHDSALSGWLRRACPRARVHGSICTGAFALGHAGLLDGHTVTTHWEFADELATRFPAARVEPDRIHAQRRADHLGRRNRRHRPGPGAGGRGPWRGTGAAHRAEAGGGGPAARRAIAVQPLPERATGSGHADRAGTGPCDGTRRRRLQRGQAGRHRRHERSQLRAPFHAGRRHHAARIIERARVDAARRLLEGSRQPLKAIAYDCGFGNADNMRRVFQRRLRVSPADYRARFNRDA